MVYLGLGFGRINLFCVDVFILLFPRVSLVRLVCLFFILFLTNRAESRISTIGGLNIPVYGCYSRYFDLFFFQLDIGMAPITLSAMSLYVFNNCSIIDHQ